MQSCVCFLGRPAKVNTLGTEEVLYPQRDEEICRKESLVVEQMRKGRTPPAANSGK